MDEHKSSGEAKGSRNYLLTAIRSGFVDGVALLIKGNPDSDFPYDSGQTPLYVAVQFGFVDCVKLLLDASSSQNTMLNMPEPGRGWIPLIMAATSGNLPIVKLLVGAGANQSICDYRGLTAKEHAAYRGFLKVAEVLEVSCPKEPLLRPIHNKSTRKPSHTDNSDFPFSGINLSDIEDHGEPFYIFINLGSLSAKKNSTAVDLSGLTSQASPPESNLYIKMCTVDGSQASSMISLPLSEDRSNEPWLFWSKELKTVKLAFDVLQGKLRLQTVSATW